MFPVRLFALALATAFFGVPHAASPAVASAPNGFSATIVSFEHSLVCDNGVLIAAYAQTYGITTIYVPVGGDDITSLLAGNPNTVKNLQAMTAVAAVYMVAGDNSWISAPTSVPATVKELAQVAAAYPQIAGVYYDIDPVHLPGWNGNGRRRVITDYLTLEKTLLTYGAPVFKAASFLADTEFAVTHTTGNPNSPTVLEKLQSPAGLSATVLAVPGGSAAAQLSNAASSIPQMTKPFSIAASTSPYNGRGYHGKSPAYLAANLNAVARSVARRNSNFTNIAVDGWTDLYNSLQSILAQPSAFTGKLATGRLVPPAGTTYLGLYEPGAPAQIQAFEKSIGRTVAYNMHFYEWTSTSDPKHPGAFPGSAEADDIAHGRIPLDAWNCGDTDANIVRGVDDSIITAQASAIKKFKGTIVLRWFREMNLNDQNNPPRTECWDPNTDLPDGYFLPQLYIEAWQHIRAIFARERVTNVVWLWCVANAHGGAAQYYPGDGQVDWVGMDDYDKTNAPTMDDVFYILANELAQFQEKPFMVTETGARAANQVTFLDTGVADLQQQFPWVRALGYLNANDPVTDQHWILTPAGLKAFRKFAKDPYMSAMAPHP